MKRKLLRSILCLVLIVAMILPTFALAADNTASNEVTETLFINDEKITITYNLDTPNTYIVNNVTYQRIGNTIYENGIVMGTVTTDNNNTRSSWIYSDTSPYPRTEYNQYLGDYVYNLELRERIVTFTLSRLLAFIIASFGFTQALRPVITGVCEQIISYANIDFTFGNSTIMFCKDTRYAHDYVPYTRCNYMTYYKDEACTQIVPNTNRTLYSQWA